MIKDLSLLLYLFVLLVSTFFFSFYKSKNSLLSKIGISFSIMIPSIFAGIRYNVGTDYMNYNYCFSALRNHSYRWILIDSYHFNMERGFLLLSKILTHFFSNKGVFGALAFIILSIFVYTVLTQYKNFDLTLVYLAFIFLTFTNSFNILRQSLAIVIVFYSFRFIIESKLPQFLLVILLASVFHFSAILILPAWFLWDHKKNQDIRTQRKWVIFGGTIIIIFFWKDILEYLITYEGSFFSKYSRYLVSNGTNNRSFWIKLLVATVFLLFEMYIVKFDKRVRFFIYLYVIGALIEYTGFYITFVKRIGAYYTIAEGVLFSVIPYAFKDRNRFLVKIVVSCLIILYFIVGAYILEQGDIIPYQTS